MRTIARYQVDGGWKCVLWDSTGECRTSIMARKDIETHLRIDHQIREVRMLDDSRDIEDVSDLMVEMLRAVGGA